MKVLAKKPYSKFKLSIPEEFKGKRQPRYREFRRAVQTQAKRYRDKCMPATNREENRHSRWLAWLEEIHFDQNWDIISTIDDDVINELEKRNGEYAVAIYYRLHSILDDLSFADAIDGIVFGQPLRDQDSVIFEKDDALNIEPSEGEKLLRQQTLLVIKQMRSEVEQEVCELLQSLTAGIVEMLEAYELVHHPEEFHSSPWDALVHISSFVCDFKSQTATVDDNALSLVRNAIVSSEVTYGTLLKFQNITVPATRIWELIKPIWDLISDDSELRLDQHKWESSAKIFWLWSHYPVLATMQQKIEGEIVAGNIKANDMQREIVSALNATIPEYKNLEQPAWQSKKSDDQNTAEAQ